MKLKSGKMKIKAVAEGKETFITPDKITRKESGTELLTRQTDPEYLRERLRLLEETYRATLNILEDMNEERNKSGESRRALMNILEDVESERAKTEEAKALLEAVNKELEAFSYSVSHDLRAPLRAISGFSEAILEDCASRLDDEGKRYFSLIQANAHKMGQLVDDLLSFSRLSRQEMIKTRINIEELARNTFEELMAQERGRKINFNVFSCPPVYGDKATIKQVLLNLIANSIKFTRNREDAGIEVGYLAGVDEHTYYVKDNGAGFDMRYVNKLFGVFQRLHSVEEFEGTGIGLAIVHRIINRHGGRVWAKGKINEGAAFYFTLPEGR